MCEDEGTRGRVRTAEAARCGNGGTGTGRLCQWFGGGAVDDKVVEDDERDAMDSSTQPWRKQRGGKVTGRKETGRKETGGKTTGAKERGVGGGGQERRKQEEGDESKGDGKEIEK